MGGEIKTRRWLILGLVVSTGLFFITTVSSCGSARKFRLLRDKEMAARLDLEESIDKSLQEKVSLENKIKELAGKLENLESGYEADKKALNQERLISQSLKEELKKVTKAKETLEQDLKEALVINKGKPPAGR